MSETVEGAVVAPPRELPSFTDGMTTAVTLFATLALPCSVIFDWAYYSRLGLHMSQVPTSLSDHGRTAVIWAPVMGVGFALSLLQSIITRGLNEWKSTDEIERSLVAAVGKSRRTLKGLAWLFGTSSGLLTSILAISLGSYVYVGGESFGGLLFAAALAWIFLANRLMPKNDGVGPQWVRRWAFAIYLGPMIAAMSYQYGDSVAIINLKEKPSATIALSNKDVLTKLVVLRYLDRGVLVKKLDGHLMFVQWSAIADIDDARERSTYRGLGCILFNACSSTSYLDYKPAL
ncbi:hypothetical protein [Burkholderia pseudomallei]|uniref:hypothetical protein n=1 Tax=Burkholderia pseudomallei TaxID=28450 RepID=UPI0015611374|nr:hypothetical protein [Burkholderia pseudomallei]NRE46697.1 hypothetical protein [Burkholderia pseudomallei]